jgi:hypothetical protein
MKTREQKIKFIEVLREMPIIEVVCKRTNISRATYYRWRKEDSIFTNQANEALNQGSLLINDLAESQLISAIKDKNLPAIVFWLKHHHTTYGDRLEITTRFKQDEPLTAEEEKLVNKALRLAQLTSNTSQKE